MIVYVNGKFLPEEKAHRSIHGHGFLYGDGVYETLRVYKSKVFQLDGHLKRLKHSAQGIQLKIPIMLPKIGQAIKKTVDVNKHQKAVFRLTLTRGPGAYGFDPATSCKPH